MADTGFSPLPAPWSVTIVRLLVQQAQSLSETNIVQIVTQTVTACYVAATAVVTFQSTQQFASSNGMCFPSRHVAAPASTDACPAALVTTLILAGFNLAHSFAHVPGLK